ncbi:MAG: hypothetical protein A3D96_05340 [Chlamydiae bacterium RIFCSPHIGHO2_12_FULL_44_59]|nr:MAG: hypothetical protein A3D96_05340 [Chlamydiae bacterium RIFCSPHIGHO2_12_FULL_44_59]
MSAIFHTHTQGSSKSLPFPELDASMRRFMVQGVPCWAWFFAWIVGVKVLKFLAPHIPYNRPIYWAHALTLECMAFFVVFILRFFPSKPLVLGEGRPVLLVHGYMNHPNVWWFQKKWLKSLGFGPLYTISLGHPFQSIYRYAEIVKSKVDQIAQDTHRDDIILIGHSMGGLVALWCGVQLDKGRLIKDIVTIASPLQGTPVAWLGMGPNAKEMRPKSPFIEELHRALKGNSLIRFQHIATHSDQLVIPGVSACLLENPHYIFKDLGHASLLFSKRTAQKISSFYSP